MKRVVPALVVALLLIATDGGAAMAIAGDTTPGFASQTPVSKVSANTTHVLDLETAEASSVERADLSVTDGLAVQRNQLKTSLSTYAVENRYEAAETQAARRQVLQNATDRARSRLRTLEYLEEDARREYLAGERTGGEYLETLGRVDAHSRTLRSFLSDISALAPRDSPVRESLNTVRADIESLQGPIRASAGAAIAGSGPTTPTYVGASENGFVLSQVSEGVYWRETVRWDNRDGVVGDLDIRVAEERFSTIYPWAWSNKPGGFSIDLRGPDVWKLELRHSHGRLQGYLDMSSNHIYREVQEKAVDDLPTRTGASRTIEGTTLAVSETYPGGPVKVSVSNETGAPVPAEVTVNRTEVGGTGEDGVIWAVSPRGTYAVQAQHGDRLLNLTVGNAS